MATSSKITFADRHELAHSSLKHHGGLTASAIFELVSLDPYATVRQTAFHWRVWQVRGFLYKNKIGMIEKIYGEDNRSS
ncbi:hypothetical protein [Desulfobacula sp.]